MVTVIIHGEQGHDYIVYFLGVYYRIDKAFVYNIEGMYGKVAIGDLQHRVQMPL